MAYQITHIRLSDSYSSSTESISHVKLSGGTVETKQQVVRYIDQGMDYYYTQAGGSRASVETVHPTGREPYIRTKANTSVKDNLLSLPRF
ncbi:DUF3892 domain-containing protein [Halalkalibacterium halodurans]|uniref:DUF3892 domain-containing protein n=1 Tax=Halalkalibacterium halodurans TaxID=86665 RepID=UPI002AA97562|nr:DUF3892 domain-containing protein [Halalkalibacterium halodurans]MDY7222069.1 DUF3892 domain-containing protein [Halalkalibacterium halodurans]MDY7243912.1 DUF3892 domain-containing protein [Halalkalibacterium halodurans]